MTQRVSFLLFLAMKEVVLLKVLVKESQESSLVSQGELLDKSSFREWCVAWFKGKSPQVLDGIGKSSREHIEFILSSQKVYQITLQM